MDGNARIGGTCLVGDGTHSKIDRHDSGVLYLTSRNFKNGSLDLSKVYYISESDYAKHFLSESKALARPQADDLVFGIIGSIGEPYLVRRTDRFGISSSVAIVRPRRDLIDPTFLLHWFKGPVFQSALFGIKGGVAQGYVSLEMIRSLPVPKLPLPVQRRIAGILSAYDDLIENSQRRIKILETMARTLYREWFVHFRFPGHEEIPRVASALGEIPQGWEVKEMREVADVVDCLHSKKPTECPEGPGIFLQLNNIGEGGKLDLSEQFRINADDYAQWTSRIELQAGDCVITNVGRVGAVGQIPEGVKAAPGRNMTAIRVRTGQLSPTYLIEYLLSSHMASEVAKKKDLGTIMDSLNVKGIVRLHVPCPPTQAMLRFESIARPIRKRIEILVGQIQNLRRTRDLLLPRLLSGQVQLNIDEAEQQLADANAESLQPTPAPVVSMATTRKPANEPALLQVADAAPPPYATDKPPHINDTDRTDVLCAIRTLFSDGIARDRDTAIRDLAHALGYQRTGSRIHEVLATDLLTAVRRGIVVNEGGEYSLGFRSLADCTRDSMKTYFESAIGRGWINRDDAVRAIARWLGFARVGKVIDDTARSLINGLIREDRLEADRDMIRRR